MGKKQKKLSTIKIKHKRKKKKNKELDDDMEVYFIVTSGGVG